jgi:WD40 repeat protein
MMRIRMLGFCLVALPILQGCGNKTDVAKTDSQPNTTVPPKTDTPKTDPSKPTAEPIGTLYANFEGHKLYVDRIAFSGDGKTLASYGDRIANTEDRTVYLWDVEGRKKKQMLIGYYGKYGTGLRGLALTDDGKSVFVAPDTDGIVVLDPETDKITKEFSASPRASTSVAITPDAKLVVGNDGKKVLLWTDAKPDMPEDLGEIDENIRTLAISADGKVLMVAGYAKTVKCWDLATRKPLASVRGEYLDTAPCAAALSGDGTTIAAVTGKGVKWFDSKTGAEKGSISVDDDIRAIALSPDGSLLALTEWGKTLAKSYPITIWDTKTKTKLGTLPGHEKWVKAMAFSPKGPYLATAGNDNWVKLWKINLPNSR